MVCFLLFFSFLHRIDWNGELTGWRGVELAMIDSSSKTADGYASATLLLWAKMD